jgi:hypothetical protein
VFIPGPDSESELEALPVDMMGSPGPDSPSLQVELEGPSSVAMPRQLVGQVDSESNAQPGAQADLVDSKSFASLRPPGPAGLSGCWGTDFDSLPQAQPEVEYELEAASAAPHHPPSQPDSDSEASSELQVASVSGSGSGSLSGSGSGEGLGFPPPVIEPASEVPWAHGLPVVGDRPGRAVVPGAGPAPGDSYGSRVPVPVDPRLQPGVVMSGAGDGLYPVTVIRDDLGYVACITIAFFP